MAVIDMPIVRAGSREKPAGHPTANILRAEWTKFRSVRSTYWTLLSAVIMTIGLSAIVCAVVVAQFDKLKPSDLATLDATSTSLTGGALAQMSIAILGVLFITSEYGSGMIRTSFAAVPQRLHVLAAKIAVFSGVTFVVTTVSCFAAFFVGQAILSAKHINVGIGSPNALRQVVGTSLYLVVLGLIALGIGTLIRKTAGAITAVVGMLFILPVLTSFLPKSLDSIQKFLPNNAGQAIITGGTAAQGDQLMLSPWVGLGVFFLYAVVTLLAAGFVLKKRDA